MRVVQAEVDNVSPLVAPASAAKDVIVASAVEYVRQQMDAERKLTALKTLQVGLLLQPISLLACSATRSHLLYP